MSKKSLSSCGLIHTTGYAIAVQDSLKWPYLRVSDGKDKPPVKREADHVIARLPTHLYSPFELRGNHREIEALLVPGPEARLPGLPH